MKRRNSPKHNGVARAIAFALRQSETGTRVEEICRQMGVSQATARAARAVIQW